MKNGKNPWQVVRYYGPAYLTAVGTMSSAATLPVALKSAKKSPVLKGEVVDFAVPLFANIHLCGSILTEVFFVMTVSLILYGALPAMSTMVLFIVLLGVFAGSREKGAPLLNNALSSGDMTWSGNARPIPQIMIR